MRLLALGGCGGMGRFAHRVRVVTAETESTGVET